MALSRAKAVTRGGHVLFKESIRHELEARLTLEAELALAVERDEFELFYQPQLHLADSRLVGAEALIRWRHPVRGLISPAEFMPVVNTAPISEPIADWVLETACAKAAAWERAGHRVRIGVNLSPSQFRTGDLGSAVAQALARTGLSPTNLELEVTEDILLHDEQGALNTFLKIQELGVRIVFDDFGTGFASLSYLKKFPLDGLKISCSDCWPIPTTRPSSARPSGFPSNWAFPLSPKASRTGPRPTYCSGWAARKARVISSDGRCRPAISRPDS
jgi:EAL domain-containing protein (putative c-di-GMP-specific phosphodiesterase class I)